MFGVEVPAFLFGGGDLRGMAPQPPEQLPVPGRGQKQQAFRYGALVLLLAVYGEAEPPTGVAELQVRRVGCWGAGG